MPAGVGYAGTVVVLHGQGDSESGDTVAEGVGFDAQAAARRFVAVYPDGRGGAFAAGHCCGRQPTRADDVRFVVRLAGLVARRYRVDARRTFATGFSNGAFLAYRLACQQSHLFLGIASVAGTQVLRRCRPRQPVSVLHIHGRDDHPMRFAGGILGRPWIPGALEVTALWRTRNGCRDGATATLRGPGLLVRRTTGCRHLSRVQLAALERFGHAWPGAPGTYGAPSAYDATDEIGRFFGELRRRPG